MQTIANKPINTGTPEVLKSQISDSCGKNSTTNSLHVACDKQHTTLRLTRGCFALLDVEDYDHVCRSKWYAHWTGFCYYAARAVNGKFVYLHRFLMGALPGEHIDHRDRDGLNCCRMNLRRATPHQNNCNRGKGRNASSQFKGVDKRAAGWRARIRAGKQISLGTFATEEEAARAYDAKAVELFGEFARLNFEVTH